MIKYLIDNDTLTIVSTWRHGYRRETKSQRIIVIHHCNQLISSLLLVLSNSSHRDVMSVVDILSCQWWIFCQTLQTNLLFAKDGDTMTFYGRNDYLKWWIGLPSSAVDET